MLETRSRERETLAFAISLLLHVVSVFGSYALVKKGVLQLPTLETIVPDRWAGNTFDVDAVVESGDVAPVPMQVEASRAAVEPAPAEAAEKSEPESQPEAVALPSSKLPKPKPLVEPSAKQSEPRRSEKKSAPSEQASKSPEPGSTSELSNVKAAGASDERAGSTGPAVYGASNLPPGVRNLPSAFTRAIPPATRTDPAWQELPAGRAGSLRLRLELDDTGHIVLAEPVLERPGLVVPPHFARLKQRVIALLGGGQFALKTTPGAGVQTLRIDVVLSDRAPKEDVEATHVVDLGFEPPAPGRSGRAYFTLGSGRHFEAQVRIEN